jgi:uncharacterized repeat protein (TIGR03803 family)
LLGNDGVKAPRIDLGHRLSLIAACCFAWEILASCACADVTFSVLHAFNGMDGSEPSASLMQASNGVFYGTTEFGGTNDYETYMGDGTIFQVTASGGFTSLLSFSAIDPSGGLPICALAQDSKGNLYGTTSDFGGTVGGIGGGVFEFTSGGSLIVLGQFTNTAYGEPQAGVISGSDGSLYGTVPGSYTDGAVFVVRPSGTFSNLAYFNGTNGGSPWDPLIQGTDGNFYGTTVGGGLYNTGTVFRLTLAGVLTAVASIGGTNGVFPYGGIVQGSDGNFYGTTSRGGAFNFGTVYKATPSGEVTTLVSLNGANGDFPYSALVQGSDGNFWGTTVFGGSGGGAGTVFVMTPTGVLTTVLSFNGYNGGAPYAGLVQGSDGNFYGTTRAAGPNGHGVVFMVSGFGPYFTAMPVSVTNLPGTAASFTATAQAPSAYGYQWQKNSTNLVDGGNISGSLTTNLNLASVSASDAGSYAVVVTNQMGSVISTIVTLTVILPAVTTLPPTQVTGSNAVLNGTVTIDAVATAAWFQWGTTTNYGNATSPTSLGAGTNTVAIANAISGLTPLTTYHCQLVATNSQGTFYGADWAFTAVAAPTVTIVAVTAFAAFLQFDGTPDAGYSVWASTNLATWAEIGVSIEDQPGTYRFTDTTATKLAHRFYRIDWP